MGVEQQRILIAGYGSIGRRHFNNLRTLGYRDVRLLRSGRTPAEGFETPPDTQTYRDLKTALGDGPQVVIVCTPTALHAEIVRASVCTGAGVLLEKPVCANLNEARRLAADVHAADGLCSMAYCFRYHPLYREIKRVVEDGLLGRIFHAHTWQASYLPDWHPWEDYRQSYAARRSLGGGVVRTLDHDLDILRWIVGQPHQVTASAGQLSGIGGDVEDTADMIFRFPDRMQANVHVSFGRRDYVRGMWIAGEQASANLDWQSGRLSVHNGKTVLHERVIPADFDINAMYLEMLSDALDAFHRSDPAPVPLSNGVAALEMAEGALKASATRRAVALGGAGAGVATDCDQQDDAVAVTLTQ